MRGTKASAHYRLTALAKGSKTVRLRLTDQPPDRLQAPFGDAFEAALKRDMQESDAFYEAITPATLTKDQAHVMRQALAGMLWSKQVFLYDLAEWLREHGDKPEEACAHGSATRTGSMHNADVISMPDKWEYPGTPSGTWRSTVPLSLVDVRFRQGAAAAVPRPPFLHPNGQMPAYEWNFKRRQSPRARVGGLDRVQLRETVARAG